MISHAPPGYICPFCLLVQGIENGHVYSNAADMVLQNEAVTAFVSSHQWANNLGHVLIIPNAHYENIFDLPVYLGAEIHAAAQTIARAMKKAYGCDGISTRQHNEPVGNQDVWHYHLHVFPRWENDRLYCHFESDRAFVEPEKRAAYAQKLKAAL